MSEMLAYCGLLCNDCPAYVATMNNDQALREKTADEWRKMFNPDVKAEDINCLGCKSDVVYGYCQVCEIRACSKEKEMDHCGKCESFSCSKVEGILQHSPDARERLLSR
ncbi:MAG: DUF3795 domain-containing protein [Clostridia bacterium]|nr:DUF3795 domain-containing protein [Clostridia bacterium]